MVLKPFLPDEFLDRRLQWSLTDKHQFSMHMAGRIQSPQFIECFDNIQRSLLAT